MCAIQPEPPKPGNCQRWMGQACQGTCFFVKAGGRGTLSKDALQLYVFATSELSSHETTIHQCTDDNHEYLSDRDSPLLLTLC